MHRLWILVVIGLCFAPAFAEDELPPEPKGAPQPVPAPKPEPKSEAAPAPGKIIADALRKLASRDEVLARVAVSEDKPDAQAGGNVIVMMNGAGQRAEFAGDALVWNGSDGVTVVQSMAELPGFSLYVSGDTAVSRTTQRSTGLSVTRVRDEVVPLLDLDRLLRHVGNVTRWNAGVGGNPRAFAAELPKDVVDPSSASGPFSPRVLKVNATFRVGADGALESLDVRVTHNDPRREMMGGRVAIAIGPNGRPQVQRPKGGAGHDIEGVTAVYKLTFPRRAQAPARARRFKAEISQALENAEPEPDEGGG